MKKEIMIYVKECSLNQLSICNLSLPLKTLQTENPKLSRYSNLLNPFTGG